MSHGVSLWRRNAFHLLVLLARLVSRGTRLLVNCSTIWARIYAVAAGRSFVSGLANVTDGGGQCGRPPSFVLMDLRGKAVPLSCLPVEDYAIFLAVHQLGGGDFRHVSHVYHIPICRKRMLFAGWPCRWEGAGVLRVDYFFFSSKSSLHGSVLLSVSVHCYS